MSTPDYVIRIDPLRMEIELYGVRYAMEVFAHLGLGKVGDALEIVKREDGVITLQKLHLRQDSQSSEG